jgi:hypothetical protein
MGRSCQRVTRLQAGLVFDHDQQALVFDGIYISPDLIKAALISEEGKRFQVIRSGLGPITVLTSERAGDTIQYEARNLPELAGLCWRDAEDLPSHSRPVLAVLTDSGEPERLVYALASVDAGAWKRHSDPRLEVVLWRELADPKTVLELKGSPWPL